MIECIVLGDSIAVGTAHYRPECVALAKSGINSHDWNKRNAGNAVAARSVIISLGANDYKGIGTEEELRKLRAAVTADRVFWISPGQERKPVPQAAIEKIAAEYGDTVLPRPMQHMSSDGVHPTGKGYKILADQTR